ncbi:hypothetical protein [Hahella chejuensis]|uniref:hypothetical protein n=1 Tax=Hahella chejuensis TaxID=158327 RepID=UPI0005A0707B|nr:hypothetical protein [Hahella chejuensis]
MDLPENIETQIVEYVNIEYGDDALTIKDLSYIGEFSRSGVVKKYWSYPCSNKPGCWATVEEYEGSFLISITTLAPE